MPLDFKCVAPCSQTVFDAVSGEHVIGHIRKETPEGGRCQWSWRLDVAKPATSGFADDREGAKAALTDSWNRWLAEARRDS